MTNEEIFSGNPGQAEDVGYWTHKQMKLILRLMTLARADELRKVVEELDGCVSDESLIIALSLKKDAAELEREAKK